jgi:DNA-binding CsgD family transcriptional regulator
MQPCDRLTPKEVQVAILVRDGFTNREIANALGTTEQVVKNYLRKVYDKLGVADRLELALYVANHPALFSADKKTAERLRSLFFEKISKVLNSTKIGKR